LEGRVKDLITKFVSDQIAGESADPVGFAADLDRLAAFRLLAHAEVEEFLEAKAREGLATLTSILDAPGFTVRSVSGVFTLASALGTPLTVSWPYDPAAFLKDARGLIRAAEKAIADNNGVKGPSFFQLSVIAGKMPDEVDQSLGASLSSYGQSRGDVAHKSVTRVRTLQAPSAEAKAASDIVQALATYFDVTVPASTI
jgi:hypothetical protein